MPMIYFKCSNPECKGEITKSINKVKDIPAFIKCELCVEGNLERQLGAPSSKSTQVVDNGVQARKTEVMNDVIDKERDRMYNEE